MREEKPNVLRAAVVIAVAVALVLAGMLSGCAPTPFVLGERAPTPFSCLDARTRGHEC